MIPNIFNRIVQIRVPNSNNYLTINNDKNLILECINVVSVNTRFERYHFTVKQH
jgi:hypothetical protein